MIISKMPFLNYRSHLSAARQTLDLYDLVCGVCRENGLEVSEKHWESASLKDGMTGEYSIGFALQKKKHAFDVSLRPAVNLTDFEHESVLKLRLTGENKWSIQMQYKGSSGWHLGLLRLTGDTKELPLSLIHDLKIGSGPERRLFSTGVDKTLRALISHFVSI